METKGYVGGRTFTDMWGLGGASAIPPLLWGSCATIPAGSTITFEWHQHAQRTGEDAISGGHKGPVQVFIAKAPSTAASFDGQGAVWTKIYSSGLIDPSSQQWATDVVNANGGKGLRSRVASN